MSFGDNYSSNDFFDALADRRKENQKTDNSQSEQTAAMVNFENEKTLIPDSAADGDRDEKRTRRSSIEGKYSQEDFINLSEEDQIQLLNLYLIEKPSAEFEDGTFQFSRTTLLKLAETLGFRKTFSKDTNSEDNKEKTPVVPVDDGDLLYIDRGRRVDTVEKKITLSGLTNSRLEDLLGNRLSNIEKSKATDAILSYAIDILMERKKKGKFGIAYRPTELERIV